MSHAYRFAVIADHFKLTPQQVADLTDYQINRILFAKRKKTGEIEVPPDPPPLPASKRLTALPPAVQVRTRKQQYFEAYQTLFSAYQNKLISQENFQETTRRLQEKYSDLWPQQPQVQKEQQVSPSSTPEQDETLLLKYKLDGLISDENYNEAVKRLRR